MNPNPQITRYTRAALIAITSLGLCVGAFGEGTFSPDQVEGPVTWGSVSNVTHLSHLYFAGQPDQAGMEKAKAEGVSVVINLRDPSEHAWDEKSAVEALGMTYYNVPVRGVPFDKAAFAEIETLVKQHHGEEILVHCASSNRVGGWLATHLAGAHGMSADDAIEVGRRAGITKQPIADAVRAFLSD
ncbi:MAG: hypothetical protein JRH01_18300 [Deltaproteobacteria bacterium]|nr:hypothetical protein [Deltaproteobacteria bacterium]MBW2392725.1 hypothetical protein [Deltaproteobacteria bacterium]